MPEPLDLAPGADLDNAAGSRADADRHRTSCSCGGGAGGARLGTGLRTHLHGDLIVAWAREHDLSTDPDQEGTTEKLTLTLAWLRLTYNELRLWVFVRR
jgi:hypothetical protein